MAYSDRQYRVYLVLGDIAAPPLWDWTRWTTFSEQLDPVLEACRDKAHVRVDQYDMTNRADLKFGRLQWSPASHVKWTHSSPKTSAAYKDWSLIDIEVAAPGLSVCAKEGSPPDFFMAIHNEDYGKQPVPVRFNPRIFMAIAADMPEGVLQRVEKVARSVSAMVSAQLTATIDRSWGIRSTDGYYSRAIQDIVHTGLFKLGHPHKRPVDLTTLEESWRIF